MKSILLIGLGRFGRHIAIKLDELHHQVMAVDKEDTRVDAVLPFVTNAQIGDATNEDFLSSLGVGNFDVCIVAIGDNFQNSLEVTSLLKELGAKMVVSRAAPFHISSNEESCLSISLIIFEHSFAIFSSFFAFIIAAA